MEQVLLTTKVFDYLKMYFISFVLSCCVLIAPTELILNLGSFHLEDGDSKDL
jgi:hypothetical protein